MSSLCGGEQAWKYNADGDPHAAQFAFRPFRINGLGIAKGGFEIASSTEMFGKTLGC